MQSPERDKGVVVVEGLGGRSHNDPSIGVGKAGPLLVGLSRLVVEISNEEILHKLSQRTNGACPCLLFSANHKVCSRHTKGRTL